MAGGARVNVICGSILLASSAMCTSVDCRYL